MGDRDERAVRVSVGDVELATRQRGRGIPFLWGHGLMGSMAQEQALGLFLWQQVPARVIHFDARSHGESDLDLDPAHLRWPALARDMLALAKAAGAPRAVLGGVSMGCATSLHAALREPDRVAGLVLVAPPTAWETRPRQSRFYRVAATAVDWLGLAPIRLFAALPRFGPQSPVAALQAAVVESLAGANPRAVAAAMRGAADSDLPAPGAAAPHRRTRAHPGVAKRPSAPGLDGTTAGRTAAAGGAADRGDARGTPRLARARGTLRAGVGRRRGGRIGMKLWRQEWGEGIPLIAAASAGARIHRLRRSRRRCSPAAASARSASICRASGARPGRPMSLTPAQHGGGRPRRWRASSTSRRSCSACRWAAAWRSRWR